ncbi:MAG: flagellar biosynthesis protein FlhF [Defluviitaleaceae bacterium]|nr:flagellar biosynthesis protein FlhF [Defluviitaleaceae bacterium]
MKVKRYEGKSEAALMPVIMEEMGEGATIISVKQKPAGGFFGFFRQSSVVITAACEDDAELMKFMNNQPEENVVAPPDVAESGKSGRKRKRKKPSAEVAESKPEVPESDAIGESMSILLQEARKAANQIEIEEATKRAKTKVESHVPTPEGKKYNHSMVQLFYDTMLEQEVLPEVAQHLLRELEDVDESDRADVRILIKSVYGSLVDILKNPTLINTEKSGKSDAQAVVFMGPTGVGKTTTIAKLSSILTLKHGLRVGLITADTYRIAAVEQLKTYADILGLDIRVVYKPDEMQEHLRTLRKKNDIVLIDTAGRSHKSTESIGELKQLLDAVPDSRRYLVLSVTTRYRDLCKIVSVFDGVSDFDLIFTKLDEAEALGVLMNVCCLAGKKAAYVTFGQNVPDDLESVKPDKIAKSLLGLAEGEVHPYAEGGGQP